MTDNNLALAQRHAPIVYFDQAGVSLIRLRYNERYPIAPTDSDETSAHSVQSYDDLRAVLQTLG